MLIYRRYACVQKLIATQLHKIKGPNKKCTREATRGCGHVRCLRGYGMHTVEPDAIPIP